jgi:hypothetical protein
VAEEATMRLLLVFGVCASLTSAGQQPATAPETPTAQNQAGDTIPPNNSTLTIPSGTKLVLAMTSPVWTRNVQPGDPIYAATAFPSAVDDQMAVPPGTYVEGRIDSVTKPTRHVNRAEFQIHFTKLIFANGYTVLLAENPPAASATVDLDVNFASDILLDLGTQFDLTVQIPLVLDSEKVAQAALRSKAPPIHNRSATRCRSVLPTEGTSDTVIPGAPGIPGTPPTVIPGGPGMPPTVIPGTPGTPGTPPTIIPGSAGSPGYVCPGPPIVVSERLAAPVSSGDHVEYAKFATPVELAGKMLPAGTYQIVWSGAGPATQVSVNQKGNLVVSVPAHLVPLQSKAPQNASGTRDAADGSKVLQSLQFQGQMSQLVFD